MAYSKKKEIKLNIDGRVFFIETADTFLTRFLGLMGRKTLPEKHGLMLENCRSIHCFFMRFPIDAIYLSKDGTVLFKETVKPWRIGRFHVKGTKDILEINKGEGTFFTEGMNIYAG